MSEANSVVDKYKYCNHYHELTKDHQIVDFGHGQFMANKIAIPLLKALNEAGLHTRSHHMGTENNFVCIIMDNIHIEVRKVNEVHADRDNYNGKMELLISWK